MNQCVVFGDMDDAVDDGIARSGKEADIDDAGDMYDAVDDRIARSGNEADIDDAGDMYDAVDDRIARSAKEAIAQLGETVKKEIRDAGSVQSLKIKNKTALNDIAVCAFTRAGIQ